MERDQRYISISSIFIFSILFLISNWNGLNLTPDSWAYINAATSIKSNLSIPTNYINWPPLYPIVLAIEVNKIIVWALLLNYFSITISLFIWMKIGCEKITNKSYFILYSLILSLSTTVLANTHFVWSESIFILLLSVFIYSFFQKNKNLSNSTLLYISGVLMCYQRNTALFFLFGILIVSLFSDNRRQFSPKILFIIIAGSCWNLYQVIYNSNNELITDLVPHFNFYQNAIVTFSEISNWFIPNFAILSVLVIVVLLSFISKNIFSTTNRDQIIWGGVLFYIFCFILIPASIDDIARLISVIFYPFIYFLFISIDKTSFKQKTIIIIISLSIFYQIARVGKNALNWNGKGVFTITMNK